MTRQGSHIGDFFIQYLFDMTSISAVLTSDAPGRNKSGFGRARALKIGLRAGSGFHYKNPGGLGLRKSGRGLKCTICPTKFERSRAHEVPSKGGVG